MLPAAIAVIGSWGRQDCVSAVAGTSEGWYAHVGGSCCLLIGSVIGVGGSCFLLIGSVTGVGGSCSLLTGSVTGVGVRHEGVRL